HKWSSLGWATVPDGGATHGRGAEGTGPMHVGSARPERQPTGAPVGSRTCGSRRRRHGRPSPDPSRTTARRDRAAWRRRLLASSQVTALFVVVSGKPLTAS